MVKLTRLGWRALIDGKEYGNDAINIGAATNEEIKMAVKIVSKQMLDSLQIVVTGKSEDSIKIDEMLKQSEEKGE